MRHSKYVISFVIILSLLFAGAQKSFASIEPSKQQASGITFKSDDAARLVIELEKGRIYQRNVKTLEKENAELYKQNALLKEQLKLTNDKLDAANELLKKSEDLNKIKTDNLEAQLKEASKPRWGAMGVSFGLGAAVMGVLILLLP